MAAKVKEQQVRFRVELPALAPQTTVTRRECGSCVACCKANSVPELEKPADVWCKHCLVGKGCGIYSSRPESCRIFDCTWLRGEMPIELTPRATHCVFWTPKGNPAIHVAVDRHHPDIFTEHRRLHAWMDYLLARGTGFIVFIGDQPPFALTGAWRRTPMHPAPDGKGWTT